jgi:hypothetical protein
MTAPDWPERDPIEWRLEATNDLAGAAWVPIHEMSSEINSPYSLPVETTRTGQTYVVRAAFTDYFQGYCNVAEGQVWRSLSLGNSHGCGINTAGAAYCWGHNDFGQVVFPGQPCNCTQGFGMFCSCTSANYDSSVYVKIRASTVATQCVNERCFNTYSTLNCPENGCNYVLTREECLQAGVAMGLVTEDYFVRTITSRAYPKGCYWRGDESETTRLYYNSANLSSSCSDKSNCVCKNCPAYRYAQYAQGRYCADTFDNPKAELRGAKTIDQCKLACSDDDSCDYFTFYPAISSASCAPCCFKKKGSCSPVDPNKILPKFGDVKASAVWSSISAGFLHTCGVDMSGSVSCWGYNKDGQAEVPAILNTRCVRMCMWTSMHFLFCVCVCVYLYIVYALQYTHSNTKYQDI